MNPVDKHVENFRSWAEHHQAVESYQFIYVPTFSRSFDMTLWQNRSGRLYTAMQLHRARNERGEEDPLPARQLQGSLDPAAWQTLQTAIQQSGFWGDDVWEKESGRDGSDWYFAGLRHGLYKFRDSWSPAENAPARNLGWSFSKLVPLSFCPVMTPSQARQAYRLLPTSSDFPAIIVF